MFSEENEMICITLQALIITHNATAALPIVHLVLPISDMCLLGSVPYTSRGIVVLPRLASALLHKVSGTLSNNKSV